MHCPFCTNKETKVIDSRLVADGDQVRRRRECLKCGERYTTFETAELVLPRVIKSNGNRQPFDEDKLRSGLTRALEKRPVSLEVIDSTINRIKHKPGFKTSGWAARVAVCERGAFIIARWTRVKVIVQAAELPLSVAIPINPTGKERARQAGLRANVASVPRYLADGVG